MTVRYDPRDVTEIKVFLGDDFLCKAAGRNRAGAGPLALKDLQRLNKDKRSKLRAEQRDRKEAVAKLIPLPAGAPRPAAGKRKRSLRATKGGPRLKRWENE